jgi:hypothetical protein
VTIKRKSSEISREIFYIQPEIVCWRRTELKISKVNLFSQSSTQIIEVKGKGKFQPRTGYEVPMSE